MITRMSLLQRYRLKVGCVARPYRRAAVVMAALALLLLPGCPVPVLETPDLTPRPEAGDTHLLRLVHISDPQIVDEESPARSVRTDDLISVSWRPQETFAVHTLDATLQRINTIHTEGEADGRPVDFVLITGDLTDLAQQNELQWFLDTMDGKTVTPDSGDADGTLLPVPDELNPKLPYAAMGLSPAIPWYTCFGNHDGLATGNFTINRDAPRPEDWFAPLLAPVAAIIGLRSQDPPVDFMLPTSDQSPAVIRGDGVPLRPDSQQLDLEALVAGPITPDPARRFLSKRDFIAMHLGSTTPPVGHGFTRRSLAREQTFYSVRPVPDVPLRLIVFDTVAAVPNVGLPLFYGALTREHFEGFIIPQLKSATERGEWIVLASHHPSVDYSIPFPSETVSTEEFRNVVSQYSGVLLHLVGHTHRNHAVVIPGTYPYLEIETDAIIDYPQEGRILDLIVERGGGTIRIESTMFSHMDAPTAFSAESYRRARLEAGILALSAPSGKSDEATGNPGGMPKDRDFVVRLPRPAKLEALHDAEHEGPPRTRPGDLRYSSKIVESRWAVNPSH